MSSRQEITLTPAEVDIVRGWAWENAQEYGMDDPSSELDLVQRLGGRLDGEGHVIEWDN